MPIFKNKREFTRMMKLIDYYQFKNTPSPFSKFIKLSASKQEKFAADLKKRGKFQVEIICFCLMPNHFHFLLKQLEEEGITIFLKNIQTSYAKYFNIKYERLGPLFQNRFKAILVENDNQSLHLSRYIHLNPYSSLIIKKKEDLLYYPWSSFRQYLGMARGFCQTEIILEQFKNSEKYRDFVFDQADYQRELEKLKHLLLE